MATVNLGRIKPVFKGTWSNSTAYTVDDFVVHSNECYIAIQAGSNQNPASASSYWTKIAAKGTDGTDIGTTLTTQGDILYRDGSGLQRLGAGTAGQLLQTGGASANVSWTDAPSGVIKKVHHFSNSTRTVPNNAAGNDFTWTTSFTPLDPVNNLMIVSSNIPCNGAGNNFCGFGPRFSKSGGSDYDFQGYGSGYTFAAHMTHQNNNFVITAGTLAAGTYTIYHRVYSQDSNPDSYMPNSSDDARLTAQTRGELIIQEYKNS